MAELIIQTKDSPNPKSFQDGDIIHAHNDDYLLWKNTQRITDHRKEDGVFKAIGGLAYERLLATSKYKFERISHTEVRRTLLSDMSEEVFSNTPNKKGEAMDVNRYVFRRIFFGKAAMFGDEANAVWFGGRTNLSNLSTLWTDKITPETGLLESDHKQLVYPPHFLKKHLVVVTEDFDFARRGVLEAPDMDKTDPENPVMIAMRKHKVDWRNMVGMTIETIGEVEDATKEVQVKRDLVRNEADIVAVK